MKLAAKELRASEPTKAQLAKIKRRDIYIICDNVLDTYNIGSIFRLADAVAAKCVYLCGQSETPPNPRIAKASVGTDKWVPWEYKQTAVEAIKDLRSKFSVSTSVIPAFTLTKEGKAGIQKSAGNWILDPFDKSQGKQVENDKKRQLKVVAIEQSKNSVDFRKTNYRQPIAFVVGHETEGVSKDVLKMSDEVVEIPMFGVNISLNVMVSLAIVLYRAI